LKQLLVSEVGGSLGCFLFQFVDSVLEHAVWYLNMIT